MRCRAAPAWLLVLALTGCWSEPPLRIGLLASLAGRSIATGQDGRNGALLAVEQRNAAGGVGGRMLELVVQDNGPDADSATRAMRTLVDAKVQAVVGPFASFAALAALPLAESEGIVLLSPTATASSLAGLDDQLLLMSAPTRLATQAYAAQLWQRGHRRLVLATAVERRNAVFYKTWRDEFSAAFRQLGGELLQGVDFESGGDIDLRALAERLLSVRPDGVVLVAQVIDTVRLAQQLRRLAPDLPLVATDAATTDALIRLGGSAVEGMLLAQARDLGSAAAAYQAFVQAFSQRFGSEPGHPAVIAYDAVMVLAEAQLRRGRGESLKQALLRRGPYPGLQGDIGFDRMGDVRQGLQFAVVREGRFQAVP